MTDENLPSLPVLGYSGQTTDKVAMVNSHKISEEELLRHIDRLLADGDGDPRCLSIAKTKFDEAWMWLNRAVFRPGRVKLPGDASEEAT